MARVWVFFGLACQEAVLHGGVKIHELKREGIVTDQSERFR